LLGRQPELCAGHLVIDHGPANALLHRLRTGGELRALGRRQHAGLARADRLLERFDSGDRALAELAVDQAVEVPREGEIVLDAHMLRQRQARGAGAGGALGLALALGLPLGLPFLGSAFFSFLAASSILTGFA